MMTTIQLTRHIIDELSPILGRPEAGSVARLLLEDVFGWRRGSHPRKLSEDEQLLAWTAINRLKAGEPVQYVTGIADFYGLQLKVTPAVLIPRPETEELVEWILEENAGDVQFNVLDLGTGSGCIPLALKARRPNWSCSGVDLSEKALEIAKANADRLQLDIDFGKVDVLEGTTKVQGLIAGEKVGEFFWDIIVSNPPYIPPSEKGKMSASTLAHEPDMALFVPEADALIFYRRIAEIGQVMLKSGGKIYVETNEFNNELVEKLFIEAGYVGVERRQDLQGKWRMVRGNRSVGANAGA